MANVTAAEFTAARAIALVLDRSFVFRELRVFQIQRAGRRKRSPVAREPRWQHAIEHVDAARDHFQQLRWSSEPHRVTRFVARQKRFARFYRAEHFFLRFADTHPADRVTVEIKIDKRLRALLSQLFKCRALDNSENKLPVDC